MPDSVLRDVEDFVSAPGPICLLVFPNISPVSFRIVSCNLKVPKVLSAGRVDVDRSRAVDRARRAASIAATQYTCDS